MPRRGPVGTRPARAARARPGRNPGRLVRTRGTARAAAVSEQIRRRAGPCWHPYAIRPASYTIMTRKAADFSGRRTGPRRRGRSRQVTSLAADRREPLLWRRRFRRRRSAGRVRTARIPTPRHGESRSNALDGKPLRNVLRSLRSLRSPFAVSSTSDELIVAEFRVDRHRLIEWAARRRARSRAFRPCAIHVRRQAGDDRIAGRGRDLRVSADRPAVFLLLGLRQAAVIDEPVVDAMGVVPRLAGAPAVSEGFSIDRGRSRRNSGSERSVGAPGDDLCLG